MCGIAVPIVIVRSTLILFTEVLVVGECFMNCLSGSAVTLETDDLISTPPRTDASASREACREHWYGLIPSIGALKISAGQLNGCPVKMSAHD